MKKILLNSTLICIILFTLTGCPFESKVTLNSNDALPLDDNLLGKWKGKRAKGDKETIELKIDKLNAKEYVIEFTESEPGKKTRSTSLFAFAIQINKDKIVSIKEKDIEGYTFYKYRIKGNKLKVSYVSDEFIQDNSIASTTELTEFFKKNIEAKGFFEHDMIFKKSSK